MWDEVKGELPEDVEGDPAVGGADRLVSLVVHGVEWVQLYMLRQQLVCQPTDVN